MIRRATLLDLEEMLEIARECYPPFDEAASLSWGQKAMFSPDAAFFRSDDAWGCSQLSELFFSPGEKRANMVFLAARKGKAWEALKVLREMVRWARVKGAVAYHWGEETGMNMEPLAKRVGATRDRPSYRVEFRPNAMQRFWGS